RSARRSNRSRSCWWRTLRASPRCLPSTPADAWCSSTSSRASRASKVGSTSSKTALPKRRRRHRSAVKRIGRSDGRETYVLSKLDTARRNRDADVVIRKVVRKHGHEAHSSAWKVAFADFCLALLALFLVLWLLAAREQERLQELLKTPGSLIDEGRGRLMETSGGPRGSLISREPMPSRGDRVAKRSLASGDSDPAGPGSGIRLSKTLYETRADMGELADALERLTEQAGLTGNVRSLITPYGLRVMLHDTEKRG